MATYLAVDIGGTFVDTAVFDDDAGLEHVKTPTERGDLVEGIRSSFDALSISLPTVERFTHGTTVGLNAVLERDGATTGLLTNERFEDVLEIGRGQVEFERRYEITYEKPDPLVPRRRRVGVPGRINAAGEVVEPLDNAAVREAVRHLVEDHDIEAVAVCLLHAYENLVHERQVAEIVTEEYPDLPVSISSDISREYREYERTSTTVVDAYVKPSFGRYIDRLADALADAGFDGSFLITRSGGGAVSAIDATTAPVDTVFSGPAGGIIGASYIADAVGRDDVISFDRGGTSLDACIVSGGEPEVDVLGMPVSTRRDGWGLAGGGPGARNEILVRGQGDWEDRIDVTVDNDDFFDSGGIDVDGDPFATGDDLKRTGMLRGTFEAGERLSNRTGGGGGYGDPLEREPEHVLTDVREGYVSREAAREEYGVVITDKDTIDWAATENLRSSEGAGDEITPGPPPSDSG